MIVPPPPPPEGTPAWAEWMLEHSFNDQERVVIGEAAAAYTSVSARRRYASACYVHRWKSAHATLIWRVIEVLRAPTDDDIPF